MLDERFVAARLVEDVGLVPCEGRLVFAAQGGAGEHHRRQVAQRLAADRVDLYAYDDRGADVEVERLPSPPLPRDSTSPTRVKCGPSRTFR